MANRWTIWDIGIEPSKELSLKRTNVGTSTCNYIEVAQPEMSRIGDRPPEFPLPDPAGFADRSEPPAADGFDGNYDLATVNRDNPDITGQENEDITTVCLRDEPRCVTTAVSTEARDPDTAFTMFTLEFADDQFVGTFTEKSPPCNGSVGGSMTQTLTVGIPEDLPIGPIEHLDGKRTSKYSSGCPTATDNISFDRLR
jgi:hypothetical protein